jgi:hypothetical protein
MREAYKELSQIYNTIGDYKEAYKYSDLFIRINDTINNLDINSRIAELETRFQIEKKENEIEHFKSTSELYERNSATEKRNKYFLLITFILCIAIAVSNLRRIIPDFRTILNYSIVSVLFIVLLAYILVISGFYSSEFTPYLYFKSIVDVLTVVVFPLFAFVLLAERFLLKKHLKTAEEISEKIQEYNLPDNETIIKFSFDNEKDKLELDLRSLVCITGSDNYSTFYYYKDNQLKKELFRVTLKKLEDQLTGHDEITRCHKSFIVNIKHIKRVYGNAQGYKLHFQDLNFEVPVSRKFPKEMMEKIRSVI